ncbi:hypothetical protein NSQ54_05245 [Alkalihalobacillus sp. FSL W8-0930]
MKSEKSPIKTDKSIEKKASKGNMIVNTILFLPIFLMNLVGIFDRSYFADNSIYFVVVAALDLILIMLFYSNITTSKGFEKFLYIVLSSILTLCLISCSIRVIFY